MTDTSVIGLGDMGGLYKYFSDSVADEIFERPEASMATYAAALDDALSTFEALGTSSELPKLFRTLLRAAFNDGLGHQAAVTRLKM